MKTKLIVIIVVSFLLTGCDGISTVQNNKPTPFQTDASREIDTTLAPTPSPAPTSTPTPTPIPVPDTLADYVPTESYFTYNGSGDDVITNVKTESYSCLKFSSDDDGHKAIKAHYDDTYDLLVNTVGSYFGYTLLYPNTEYTIEVSASGDWNLEIFELGTSSKDSFTSKGDWVSPIFISSSDIYEMIADGDGHFAVKGYYGNDDYDLLVNTTDPYSGKIMFKKEGEYCFFVITGERDWSIQPK